MKKLRSWTGFRSKEVEIMDWTYVRRRRDLRLDLVEKKERSSTGLRREEVEIMDWT